MGLFELQLNENEKLTREEKAAAMQGFRQIVAAWKQKELLGPKGDEGVENLRARWTSAMNALETTVNQPIEGGDAALWELLFEGNDEGILGDWKNEHLGDLTQLMGETSAYQHGEKKNTTHVDDLKSDAAIKKWGLACALTEMQEDLEGVVGFVKSCSAEQEKIRDYQNSSRKLNSLGRVISWTAEERQAEERRKKENPEAGGEEVSTLDLIDFARIEDYGAFVQQSGEWDARKEKLHNIVQQRLTALERLGVVTMGRQLSDSMTQLEQKEQLRLLQIKQQVLSQEPMMPVVSAEQDVKDAQTKQENLEKELAEADAELKNANKRLEFEQRAYDRKYAEQDRKKREELQKEIAKAEDPQYIQEVIAKDQAKFNEYVKAERQRIASLDSGVKEKDTKKWEEIKENTLERKKAALNEKIAVTTSTYHLRYGDIGKKTSCHNFTELDEAIKMMSKNERVGHQQKWDEEHGAWTQQLDEAKQKLLNQEKLMIYNIGVFRQKEEQSLEKEKETVAKLLEEGQALASGTEKKLKESEAALEKSHLTVGSYNDLMRKRLPELDKKQSDLLAEREQADAELAQKSISHFSGEWADLLLETKKNYRDHAPELIAAEIAQEAGNQIKNDELDDAVNSYYASRNGFRIDWTNMSLEDFDNQSKMREMKRNFCGALKDRPGMEEEFDRRAAMHREQMETLIARTTEAYAYKRELKDFWQRTLEGREKLPLKEKYAPMEAFPRPTEKTVEHYREASKKRTAQQLMGEAAGCASNARTLMRGTRVFELEKKKDAGNVKRWEEHFKNEDVYLDGLRKTMKDRSNMVESYLSMMKEEGRLSEEVDELRTTFEQETKDVNDVLERKKINDEALAKTKEEILFMAGLATSIKKQGVNAVADVATELKTRYADHAEMRKCAKYIDAVDELQKQEPVLDETDSPELAQLKKLQSDMTGELERANARLESDTLEAYKQRAEENLQKEIDGAPQRIEKEARVRLGANVSLMMQELEKVGADVESEAFDAKEFVELAQQKYDGVKQRVDLGRQTLENAGAKLQSAREQVRKTNPKLLEQYDNIAELELLYREEGMLGELYKDAVGTSKKRAGAIQTVEGMKTAYDAVRTNRAQANNVRGNISKNLLKPETDKLLTGVNRFLNMADVGRENMKKANSKVYTDMNSALKQYKEKADKGELKTPEDVIAELNNMKQKASEYLYAKQHQWHRKIKKPSAQATIRMDYARRVMAFCDSGIEKINRIAAQTNELDQTVAAVGTQTAHLDTGAEYKTTGEFFQGFVRGKLQGRKELTIANESKVRKETMEKELYDQMVGVLKDRTEDPKQMDAILACVAQNKELPETTTYEQFSAIDAYRKQMTRLNEAYERNMNNQLEPFSTVSTDRKDKIDEFMRSYAELDSKRSKLELAVGVREPAPEKKDPAVQEQIQNPIVQLGNGALAH